MPLTIGHEFSGVITDVGDGVTGFAEGDRVADRAGLQVRALRAVPRRQLQRLPADRLPRPDVRRRHGRVHRGARPTCCTSCRTTCRWNSVRWSNRCRWPTTRPPSARSRAGDTAMVFGAGPIGIGLWFALRGKGLDDVFVVEPSPTRRAAIEALGARTLDPTSVDVPAFIADHTERRRRRRGVRRRRRCARGRDGAGLRRRAQADGQRRDLRKAVGHTAAQPGDERVPDPGLAVLHRRRLRGRHRLDGQGQPTTPPAG